MNEYVCKCDYCGKLFVLKKDKPLTKKANAFCQEECKRRYRRAQAITLRRQKLGHPEVAKQQNAAELAEYIAAQKDGWENQVALAKFPLRTPLATVNPHKSDNQLPVSVKGWSLRKICRTMAGLGYGGGYGRFLSDVEYNAKCRSL